MKRRLILSAIAIGCMSVQGLQAQTMVALTNGSQIFVINDVTNPGAIGTKLPVTGVDTGQTMVSIDTRPATGELYGFGYNPYTNESQLYVINTTSGLTTAIGSPVLMQLGNSTKSISIDFNPTVDKVRVVGENGANYRMDPVTGAIVATDDSLHYASGDVNSGIKPHIGAIAYTNSYVGSNTTELYNFDEKLNTLTTQNPPNAGILNTINNTGIFLDTINSSVGMDIYMNPTTLGNVAYIAANDTSNFADTLYSIDLNTGIAASIGVIGNGEDVRDIAVLIDRSFQPLTGQLLFALQKGTNNLFNFDSDNPTVIRNYMAITGITNGQMIAGIDFRPSSRDMYALGYNDTGNQAQLYTINIGTWEATKVGTALAISMGAGAHIGFDFDPATDRIRVVSSVNGANYRIDPNTGALEATDANLSYTPGDTSAGITPGIGSIAYTSYNATTRSSILFGIDDSLGALVTIAPPNLGTINTAIPGFIILNPADRTSDIDFFYDSTNATDIGYMAFNTGTDINDRLFSYTVVNGLASAGNIGLGISVTDIAAQPKYNSPSPVSVKEMSKNSLAITAYPNPASDQLHIAGKDVNGAKAIIYDMSGKMVYSQLIKDNSVQIANLPAGNYVLNITSEKDKPEPINFIKK